jgi:hypothetical protein
LISFRFFPHIYHVSNRVKTKVINHSNLISMFQISIIYNETCYNTSGYVTVINYRIPTTSIMFRIMSTPISSFVHSQDHVLTFTITKLKVKINDS